MGKLVQLNISPGGMPKLPIPAARVTVDGVPGDWQKNRKYHGGPDRAVCLYSAELYDQLRTEDVDLQWGSLGENFTTQGIDYAKLNKGSRLRVGGCMIEITEVRTPCRSLKTWNPLLPQMMVGRSGWVAKVVEEGDVRVGDEIQLIHGSARTEKKMSRPSRGSR